MGKTSSSLKKCTLKIFSLAFLLVSISALFQSALGATLNLTAKWTANTDAVTKYYRLYRTDVTRTLIGTVSHPNTSLSFPISIPDGSSGTLLFVLTAADINNNESADSNSASYSYDLSKVTFSGSVRSGTGAGISGVVMSGLPRNPSTDNNGYYSATVSFGWSGTVTPTKSGGYTFTPASRSYSNVILDQTGQDYTGVLGPVNQPPVAVISATPISGNVPLNVALSGSTSGDPDGTIQSYSWSFGDGGTGAGVQVNHTYALPGNYTVILTVTDNFGASSSTNVNISATPPPPHNDLVALWALDDGGGTVAVDSSGMGNNAAVNGGAAWVSGEVGDALSLDGVNDSMTVSSVKGLVSGNTPHTIAGWVNLTKLPPSRAWILLLGNEGYGSHHWLINSSGAIQLGAWSGGQVTPLLPVGQWKHVAVTFDGTTLSGYVDGVLVGTHPATFNLQGIPLTVGQEFIGENKFNGMIDDLRIYDRALSQSEVQLLLEISSPIGYWALDEGVGMVAVDSSGMGNSAAVNGGAAWVSGEVGGALRLDGVNDSMTVPNIRGLASGNTPHTIAAWINVTKLPPNRAWILLLGNEGYGSHHWLINSSGAIQLGAWSGGQVTPLLPVGQWKHVAVTFDGTTLSGYVDGVLVGTHPATFNLQGIPLTVGQEFIGENKFNGMIDDLRIYSRALTGLEVSNLRYVP